MPVKVNLFIVGEQKAGTTFLYNYLRQHPAVCMSAVKEPDFFCTDLSRNSLDFHGQNLYYDYPDLDSYHDLFSDFTKPVRGEASSVYLYSKEAARNISDYNPDARIIIMLREPVSFLHSLHSQYLKETTEDVEDFMTAYNLSADRLAGRHIPKRVRSPSLSVYSERIRYARNMERYLKYFHPDQIMLIFFESFIQDNQKWLERIMDFLAIDSQTEIEVNSSNPNRVPRNQKLFVMLHNPTLKKLIKTILPKKYFESFKDFFNKIFLKKAKRTQLSETDKKSLQTAFSSEVIKLARLIEEYGLAEEDPVNLWHY